MSVLTYMRSDCCNERIIQERDIHGEFGGFICNGCDNYCGISKSTIPSQVPLKDSGGGDGQNIPPARDAAPFAFVRSAVRARKEIQHRLEACKCADDSAAGNVPPSFSKPFSCGPGAAISSKRAPGLNPISLEVI